MKYKIVRQPDEMNCGIACLAMICSYYGVDKISLATIREFAKTDRDGTSLYGMKVAAKKLNMECKAFEADTEDFLNGNVKFPIVVHTLIDGLYQHYMVVFEANDKGLVIGDPANRAS